MNLGANPVSFTSSCASRKSVDAQFPAGLRVLVVDDDLTCLRILEKMLRNCHYEVTKCSRAEVALKLLRDHKGGYDIVLSDVHMPDMDGFSLLEHVGLEMELPVIMMSADDSKDVVMKGVTHGACDYLIKPIRMEALKNIWQHVVRRKKQREREFELSGSEDGDKAQRQSEDADYTSSAANEGAGSHGKSGSKKRKEEEEEDDIEERDDHDTSTLKKPRVVWTVELHQQFVSAVNQLGIDKAVPKKILELMNVPGLTRENVASHLQKYRIYLRKLNLSQRSGIGSAAFIGTHPDAVPFGTMTTSSLLQPYSGQQTIQNAAGSLTNRGLVDQRSIVSFENTRMRPTNLLHGIPTNMDSNQLAAALHRQSEQEPFNMPPSMLMIPSLHPNQGSSLVMPSRMAAQPSQVLNEVSHHRQFPSGSLLGHGGLFNPSFSCVFQHSDLSRSQCLGGFVGAGRNMGLTSRGTRFVKQETSRGGDDPLAIRGRRMGELEQEVGVSNNSSSNVNPPASTTADSNSSRNRGLPDIGGGGFQSYIFSDEGEDDVMSALLRQTESSSSSILPEYGGLEGFTALDDLPV